MEVFTLRTCRGRGVVVLSLWSLAHIHTPKHPHTYSYITVLAEKRMMSLKCPPNLTSSRTSANSILVTCINTYKVQKHGQTGIWVASSHGLRFGGSDSGFVCLCVQKVFVSVFFLRLRPMMCVTMEIRFSTQKKSKCWLCSVWTDNSCDTSVKSTPSWVVKILTDQKYRWPWLRVLTHFKFWKIFLKESIVFLIEVETSQIFVGYKYLGFREHIRYS